MSVTLRRSRPPRRYHARAEQREGVIDHLRSELEVLRRGERRGLLRPLLAELCRLRDDLLGQAATLPADFDAAKGPTCCGRTPKPSSSRSENNGVVTYAPESGDRSIPRLHRRVGGEADRRPGAGRARRRGPADGYLDIEANSPLAPAEVGVVPRPRQATRQEQ